MRLAFDWYVIAPTRIPLRPLGLSLVMVVCAVGCARAVPKGILDLAPESLAERQLQTRRFDTTDEKNMLSASAAVLQDLGFTIEASAPDLGLIVGAKDLSAIRLGQVAASILVGVLTAALTRSPVVPPWDAKQRVRVSLVTRPSSQDGSNTLVRVTFQRIIWDSRNAARSVPLTDKALDGEFFDKLSKAVFLDAHDT